jgi:HSP20 family protein
MANKKPETQEAKAPAPRGLSLWGDFPFFMSRMRDEFDRIFERIGRDLPSLAETNGWRWGVDMEEKDDAIVVRAEAPGFEPGEFDVQVTDDRLVLKASHKAESKDKEKETWQQQEYYHAVSVPSGIDKNKVEATYHNGVLTVTLPKTPEGKGRKVAVKGK